MELAEGRGAGGLLCGVVEDDAQRHGADGLAVHADLDFVGAGFLEFQSLEVEDDIAGDEDIFLRQPDFHDGLKRADDGLTIFIDEGDAEFVLSFVAGFEAQAKSEGAGRVDDGDLPGEDLVERADDAEFAVIIDGCVAEGCYLDIHSSAVARSWQKANGEDGWFSLSWGVAGGELGGYFSV